MHHLHRFIASGFGSGYLPKMPGTWGSIVALFVCLFIPLNKTILFFCTLISFIIGWFCSHKIILSQPIEQEDSDPSWIVIDEIAGYFLTVYLSIFFLEFLNLSNHIPNTEEGWFKYILLGIGFLTFRLFDIWKPFPIQQIECRLSMQRSRQAFGIMLDDLLAAIYASLLAVGVLSRF